MTQQRLLSAGMLLLSLSLPVPAADADRHGVGLGLANGNIDSDGSADENDFDGFSVYGRYGSTEHWGLLVSYRGLESDEPFIDNDYDQFGVHAVYRWRAGRIVRPHVKFGLVRTDFEARLTGGGRLTDNDNSFSFGGGLEVGKTRYAFFADADFADMDLILMTTRVRT